MTFLTWSLLMSPSIVGASDGIVEPPRVPFETQVSPLAPCPASAWYKLIGMPTTANPPNPTTEPAGISRTASAKLGKIFDLGIKPPIGVIPGVEPGHDGEGSPQLHAFLVAGQEDVRFQEDRQHQRPVRGLRDVPVAFRAPDVIAGSHFAFVVN